LSFDILWCFHLTPSRSFSFWNTYFVINEEKPQISYITVYGRSHHQNDTQSLCKSLLLLCFLFFVFVLFCLFFFHCGTTFTCNRMPYHIKIVWRI
jgi:hypothetical protein